ncbi:amidohydrolase family protein [Cytophagaceae bacterium DM2B3-1]|uniref:Amidohydrolase family protein n=1 Tax=Xanthocytophaga flava TaxID=3048013 RepID=A0ABT7CEX1_9BACT|nr:amidohydrolase family protein [Xanthocytophaga flavus]MDJ1491632.1 amidohydrolase family protein [Xanthocytophaga flavus]
MYYWELYDQYTPNSYIMKIDAHQHFWLYTPEEFGWISDDMATIRRNFMPEDLQPELQKLQFDGCVAVQASQTLDENYFLLGLSEDYSFIKGVVGWVDLQSDTVSDSLSEFASQSKFVGVRHVVQGESDPEFMLRPAFMNGIEQLAQHNLTYDILIYHHQLPMAIRFVEKFPDQPMVLDHIAKPDIKNGQGFDNWRKNILQLGSHSNVYCKLSGMVTEANWQIWTPQDFRKYLDTVLEAFTPQRLMIGSDWPVCLVASPYEKTIQLVIDYIQSLSQQEQNQILGGTAAQFYGLE